jgi:hypothetical protein
MSAFLVDEIHINLIVTAAIDMGLGVPAFRLTNNGANMRRIKARIELLEKQATRETKETRLESGVRLIENAQAMTLCIASGLMST